MARALDPEFDGRIFLSGDAPPSPPSQEDDASLDTHEWGVGVGYRSGPSILTDETILYERVLLKTKDPTTLPKTKSVCVKWAKPWPGSKICVGWKIEYKWFWVTATLIVSTAKPVNIKEAVEECLKEAAIIAAITAIVTGGSAAAAAAGAALEGCLLRRLGQNFLSARVNLSHHWDDSWN